jgi:3-oxoacyl-[acyl-carrier protein] reductase
VAHASMTSTTEAPRTAFVSGSSRKLGRAFALEFARRGCRLVLHGLSDQKTCEATAEEARQLSGKEVLVVMGDIGSGEDMKNIADRALDTFGVVDIVINNVGFRVHQPFLEMPEDLWQRVFDVNLNGPYRACRAFAPGMVKQGWGRIVNLLGMNAIKGEEMRVALSASKQGLLGLTKALGKELGPHGVTVNAINPGYLRHELDTPEEHDRIERLSATIPVRRVGERAEIAKLAAFLCSDAAGYINGQMISPNGGAET